MSLTNRNQWDTFLTSHPDVHLLQTSDWGEFKEKFGWSPYYILSKGSGAQILFKRLPFGYSIAYIPKGPIGHNWGEVLNETISLCQKKRAIILFVEPDAWEEDLKNGYLEHGFNPSQINIQPRRTLTLSLLGNESDWLAKMKQKTRYNIRLAQKSEITIEQSSDVNLFNKLMNVTGNRDNFGVHSSDYYQLVFNQFSRGERCCLLIASYQKTPLAGLMVFRQGYRAWYFYGASNNLERQRMPAYLLQWEAMRWSAAKGCTEYDLWGVPDETEDVLESKFTTRSDGLWGVYRFKRGFGGILKRTAGVFEKDLNPPMKKIFFTALKLRKGSIA